MWYMTESIEIPKKTQGTQLNVSGSPSLFSCLDKKIQHQIMSTTPPVSEDSLLNHKNTQTSISIPPICIKNEIEEIESYISSQSETQDEDELEGMSILENHESEHMELLNNHDGSIDNLPRVVFENIALYLLEENEKVQKKYNNRLDE